MFVKKTNTIVGNYTAPSSKSHTQRALAISLLAKGQTILKAIDFSNDELTALEIIKKCGVQVVRYNHDILLKNESNFHDSISVNCHESGLCARMFTPLLAGIYNQVSITGIGSLLHRNMRLMDEIFKKFEIDFKSNNEKLPFEINGKLQPKSLQIDGSQSSQYITGLIIAYAYMAKENKTYVLDIINPTSLPYIWLTLHTLQQFGVHILFENNKLYFTGKYEFKPAEIVVERDWSSASFFMVLAAINGKISFKNMNTASHQADVKILEALQKFGANVQISNEEIIVEKHKNNPIEFDATDCPDLFPPLVALCSKANGISKIKGVHRLRNKESNRAETLTTEFAKIGVHIAFEEDAMLIYGSEIIQGGIVYAHNDHRIAMACSIIATVADAGIVIQDFKAVNKSYPAFFNDLKKLGIGIEN